MAPRRRPRRRPRATPVDTARLALAETHRLRVDARADRDAQQTWALRHGLDPVRFAPWATHAWLRPTTGRLLVVLGWIWGLLMALARLFSATPTAPRAELPGDLGTSLTHWRRTHDYERDYIEWVRHEDGAVTPVTATRLPRLHPGIGLEGYIYLLTNPIMPGVVKIGFTQTTPEQRARELYSTGVPRPFAIEAVWHARNCRLAEREIHETLAAARVSPDREFFHLTAIEAREIIDGRHRSVPFAA